MYRVSNISVVVELSRVKLGGRIRARWAQTRGGRKLGPLAYLEAPSLFLATSLAIHKLYIE